MGIKRQAPLLYLHLQTFFFIISVYIIACFIRMSWPIEHYIVHRSNHPSSVLRSGGPRPCPPLRFLNGIMSLAPTRTRGVLPRDYGIRNRSSVSCEAEGGAGQLVRDGERERAHVSCTQLRAVLDNLNIDFMTEIPKEALVSRGKIDDPGA